MNCPKCQAPLTPAEIRRLNAQLSNSMITTRRGGTKATCDCGSCKKCKRRMAQQRWRAIKVIHKKPCARCGTTEGVTVEPAGCHAKLTALCQACWTRLVEETARYEASNPPLTTR